MVTDGKSSQPAPAATVVLADDQPAIRLAVGDVLVRAGFDVVARAADGREAADAIAGSQPGIAVLDVLLPRLSGIEVARAAAETSPQTAFVFYTAHGDRVLVGEALDAGVRGFVLKDAPLDELVRAVQRVLAGEAYVDPVLAGALVGTAGGGQVAPLTDRERDVLRLLADGLSNDGIGAQLGISGETVRTHIRKAMAKLGAGTRTEAVATALRRSLIS